MLATTGVEMPRLMDCREVARVLNISRRGVHRLAVTGDLPHLYIGKLLRFDPSDVSVWVRSQRWPR